MAKHLLVSLPVGLAIVIVFSIMQVSAPVAVGIGIGSGAFVSVLVDSRTDSRPAWHWAIVNGVAVGLLAAIMMSWLRRVQ